MKVSATVEMQAHSDLFLCGRWGDESRAEGVVWREGRMHLRHLQDDFSTGDWEKVFCQTNATLHFLKRCRIMQVWLKTTMEGMMEHMKLHERIFVLRKSMGVTQEELARALGVTNQAVSKWESAQCCPDIQLLPDIADYFGVSVDELMGHETAASKNRGDIAGEHLEAAMALLKEGGEISTSVLQRRLNIGYAAAKELIRALEEQGRIEAVGKWMYRMVGR